ncbi:PQQ-binding-like beta-propeller repeat protein [Aestuariimicrobium sp. Y1814]|uniref:outer membrane protein assembly factor BamB family protein n=1 Tax=Aestuariimicrobium sp. Y1814 TaxID=3418742 RepID=UPI003DA789F7
MSQPPQYYPVHHEPPGIAAAPRPRRISQWWGVIGVSLATVASLGLASSVRPAPLYPDVPVSQYVAASGHRAVLEGEEGTIVVETSHLVGGQAWADQTPAGWASVLDLEFEDVTSRHWVTETEVGDGLTNRTLYHLGEQGLVAYSGQGGTIDFALSPALVELPPDPSPGTTWEQESSMFVPSLQMSLPLKRKASIEASALGEGCITVTYDDVIGEEPSQTVITRCPGRGIVASNSAQLSTGPFSWADKALSTTGSQVGLTALTPLPTTIRNGSLEYTTTINSPAVPLGNGFAFINQLNQHLTFLAPQVVDGNDSGMNLAWVRRPGEATIALLGAGDLVVAATSERRLVAYDVDGLLRWQVDTSDIAGLAPIQFDEDTLLLLTLDGFLTAFNLHTGEQEWRTAAPAGEAPLGWVEVEGRRMVLLAADSDLYLYDGPELYLTISMLDTISSVAQTPSGLVVADAGGLLTLVDLGGRAHWSTWSDNCTTVVSIGDVVFCPQTDDVLALSARTGETLFTRPLKAQQMFTDGSLLAVLTDAGYTMLNTHGATQYELPMTKREGVSTFTVWGGQNFFLITNLGEFHRWGRP